MPARNDVRMEVEDVLSRGLTGGVGDVHSVRTECGPQQRGDAMHHTGDMCVGLGGDLPDIGDVVAWHDKAVARVRGCDVQERDAMLVLENPIRRRSARNDLTEDAVVHRFLRADPTV